MKIYRLSYSILNLFFRYIWGFEDNRYCVPDIIITKFYENKTLNVIDNLEINTAINRSECSSSYEKSFERKFTIKLFLLWLATTKPDFLCTVDCNERDIKNNWHILVYIR